MRHLIFDKKYFFASTANNLQSFVIKNKNLDVFLTTEVRIKLPFYNKCIFYIYLETIIERIKNGYHAEKYHQDIVNETMKTDLYQRITPLFDFLETSYDITLSLSERLYLYNQCIKLDFHLIESYEADFFSYKNDLNTTFLNFIHYLSKQFNLNFKSCPTFMINAFNIFYLNIHYTHLVKNNKQQPTNYSDSIIRHHHLPLEKFTLLCESWGEQNNIKFTEHVIISILLLIHEFNLVHTKVNIFIVKSNTFIINNVLLTELKRELSSKVNIFEYEPSFTRHFEYFDKPIDLIISDLVIPEEYAHIPHIHVSEYVTEKKLTLIRQTINKIIKDKEKLIIH